MAKIILHLKPADMERDLKGWHLRLYRILREMCADDSIPFEIRTRDGDIKVSTRRLRDARFDDGNLHIIDDRSVQAKGVLNAGVAYFWEHWHLDPVGTKAFSSIGAAQYDPDALKPQRAQAFAANLKKRYLQKRRSKYDQPAGTQTFPDGAISVFFQGRYPINSGASDVTDMAMLRAVQAGAGERAIIVKPHPMASDAEDIQAARTLAAQDPRIQVSDANVHDILLASAATVSINSTVALEGFMHGVPAILFGTSDFHHVAVTNPKPAQFAAAFARALDQDIDYDRYLAWYFVTQCIQINGPHVRDKIWERFAAAGFPKSRFV